MHLGAETRQFKIDSGRGDTISAGIIDVTKGGKEDEDRQTRPIGAEGALEASRRAVMYMRWISTIARATPQLRLRVPTEGT